MFTYKKFIFEERISLNMQFSQKYIFIFNFYFFLFFLHIYVNIYLVIFVVLFFYIVFFYERKRVKEFKSCIVLMKLHNFTN